MTPSGHPRSIFKRACESGNLVVAEATARQLGQIGLEEALWLTALIALKDPRRRSRVAARWLQRLLDERPHPTIEEAALASACLAALGGPGHDAAAAALTALARRRGGAGFTER